jgi:hypothetical protein
MNQERIILLAIIALAVLASIPQIPVDAQIWGALLAIVGVVGGVLVNYGEVVQRMLVYVLSAVIPIFSDCLQPIWVVGPWLDSVLDNLALGVQGVAVGLLVMGLLARVQGAKPAAA